MSNVVIHTQITPNPNAWKFVVSEDVIASGKASFNGPDECAEVPLASELFKLDHVTQLHFFENVITVTQDGQAGWRQLEDDVRKVIVQGIEAHDTAIATPSPATPDRAELSEDMQKIEKILDRTIRPALQADGGDLDVVKYQTEENILMIAYQGACGSCPSATMGTLMAIQGILQDEFNPEIEVVPV